MARFASLTRPIEQGPSGRDIVAFFDLDRTVIAEFSAQGFMAAMLRAGIVGRRDAVRALTTAVGFELGRRQFASLLRLSGEALEGVRREEMERLGASLFKKRLGGAIFPEMRAIIAAHRAKGHTIVLLSAATRYQVESVARDLDVDHMICNDYEVRDGVLTGAMLQPLIYGDGKLQAAKELAGREGLNLSRSWFYSDGSEDVPLLEMVGNPRPTNPDKELRALAAERRWPVLDLTSRGRATPEQVVRTAATLGALAGAVAVGVPYGAVEGSNRRGVNLAANLLGDLGVAFAGIRLHATGTEHLWQHRPAVFVFNHQSQTDVIVLAKLLRDGFTGIGKKELKSQPVIGQVMRYAGLVFVDRGDHDKAMASMREAVDVLRGGTSIAIAPEGTRMPTPKLGRFKKGAFHLAKDAGVPIVPIVIHNTLDVLPRGRFVLRPADVDVTVLPPVPTATWTHDDIEPQIDALHRRYREVLGQL